VKRRADDSRRRIDRRDDSPKNFVRRRVADATGGANGGQSRIFRFHAAILRKSGRQ
jgi:hypothetical protein